MERARGVIHLSLSHSHARSLVTFFNFILLNKIQTGHFAFLLQIIENEQRKQAPADGDAAGATLRGVAAVELLAPLLHNLPVRAADLATWQLGHRVVAVRGNGPVPFGLKVGVGWGFIELGGVLSDA